MTLSTASFNPEVEKKINELIDAKITADNVFETAALADLRAGTSHAKFVSPGVLADQGVEFSTYYNAILTKSVVTDSIAYSNIDLEKDITGTLDGVSVALASTNIYSSADINVANTANEIALYGGDVGFAYWRGTFDFTHNGAGAVAVNYLPSAMTFVMDSAPVDGGGGGTVTMDSWIWGIFLDSSVSGAASLSTIHSDSWNFQSAFTTVQTANLGAGDWSGFLSDINGINDPLVAAYGFRSVIRNVLDSSIIAGFYSDIDVETASVNNNSLYHGYFHGSRDAGTNPIDAGLWVTFGDTAATFTLDETDSSLYGVKVVGNTGEFVHTHGQVYSFYSYIDSVYTQSSTETRTGLYLGGYFDRGIDLKDVLLKAGQENALIDIGTWTTPIVVSSQTEHYVPIQVNLQSNTSVAKNISAARFRVDTAAANTLTAVYAMQMRNSIQHDVASAYTCHASMNAGTMAVITGSMAVASFYLEGTGTITPAGANPVDVCNITNVHSGTGVSNCLNVCNNTASAVSTVATLSNLAGVVTDMLYMNNVNTATSAIHIKAGTLTNIINVTGAATTSVFATFDATTASTCVAPNTSAINALTAKVAIKIITNTGTYWIPAFSCTDGTGGTFN